MEQYRGSHIFLMIVLLGAVHGILVVGPKFIRPNQKYVLVISNFNKGHNKVDLIVKLEGHTNNGQAILNVVKDVVVRKNSNHMVSFNIPNNLPSGMYKISITGQRGFNFHKEADLDYLSKTISGLIQINKPVFKPGDTVMFRVIVLDTELKPPALVKTVYVTVRDPEQNVIRKWISAKLSAGVFESEVQIAPIPFFGTWKISVQAEGEELVSKTFEVKEYVLSTFDVQVTPNVIPLEKHESLNLTIDANYHFGKPVQGKAELELYLKDNILDQRKEFDMYGKAPVILRFSGLLEMVEGMQDHNVRLKVTFTEKYTNRTVVKQEYITVYSHPYRVELVKNSPTFHPGLPFKCVLQFRYHDGKVAAGITGKVEVHQTEYNATLTSDSDGMIKLELQPKNVTDVMDIIFSNNEFHFTEMVEVKAATNAYIKLELHPPVQLNRQLRLTVTCNEFIKFFVYYVVSKGNIIDTGFIQPSWQKKYNLLLKATEKMIPKAKIIVATIISRTLVYDLVEIDLQVLSNRFDLRIDDAEIKPGRQIVLSISGRPGAYVGLAAYEKGLLLHGKNHDIFWEDIMQLFDEFHATDYNEYDKIHSMGLFARTLDDVSLGSASDKLTRDALKTNSLISQLVSYRTKFFESCLWKSESIGITGDLKLVEVVPHTTSSWYLTGFSIDPVYGFGIIKKPIQFATVQPFYIVENLPYSIKRGEVAVLQFTLFNNLGAEYIADVTLYNVANQLEFIGRPLDSPSYTKSLSVPPSVGVPISFLVKPRKLGEMAVRVKASVMLGLETDGLEKVIRVIPESLVQQKMYSRIFCLDTHTSESFKINLDMDKNADNQSQKIEFRLNPNLLTTVIDNLDQLVRLPTGCGEQNMVHMAPHIVVLDYLNAIGSNDNQLVNKTTKLLRQGYQNQMRYRQLDGAFGVWQNDSSVFLTAFVAKSMQTAAKYISEVDHAMVDKSLEWLVSKQKSSGRFDEVGSMFYEDLQGGSRNGVALTSYVLVALLENEQAKQKHSEVIKKGMSYLSNQFTSINNAYDLAITTYALMLNGHSLKKDALEKLIVMSNVSESTIERYWSTTNSIETTGYALLSMVLAEKYVDGLQIMRWMVNQQRATGGFSSTQDTFVGLKALTKLAEKISPSRNDYTVQLKHKKYSDEFAVNSEDIQSKTFKNIDQDTTLMDIRVAGIGFGLLQVVYEYSLDLKNFENRFNLTVVKRNTGSDYELRLNVCANFIPTLIDELSNMALIEVNFPSGYVVDRNPISEESLKNPIKNIDIRYGSTSVVVYYNNMGIEQNCFTVTAYRRFKVTLIRPAHVIVYDYYNPNLNAVKVYEVDQPNVCKDCHEDDCSLVCEL